LRRRLWGVVLSVSFALASVAARADIWQDPAFEKLRRAVKSYNAKDLVTAETLCLQSLKEYTDNILAHHLLGEIYLEKGRHAEAAEHFRRTVALYPRFAEGHRKLGMALVFLKDYKNALIAFQQALSFNPKDLDALKGLALASAELGNTGSAVHYYNQVLARLGGKDVDTLLALINLYEKLGDAKSAIRQLELLLTIRRTAGRVKRLAILKYNTKDYKGAIPLLEELIRGGKPDADTCYTLGMSRHALGDKNGAIKALLSAVEIDKKYVEAYFNLGVLYLEAKQVPRAVAALGKAVEANPDFVRGYETLGQINEHFRYDIEEAKRWYLKAEEAKKRLAPKKPASKAAPVKSASRPAKGAK